MNSNLTIGILEAGIIDDHLIAKHGTYAQMFVDMFKKIDPSLIFRNYKIIEQQYPKNLRECDAYLVTGSKSDAFANELWMLILREFIRKLYRQNIPQLGICFGHQIIAIALGGKAERNPKGWGIGVHKSQMTHISTPPSWLHPKIKEYNLLVSHQDIVTALPPNSVLLASNDFCQNSAFYIDNKVLCFQGHPEISPLFARGLMELRKHIIPRNVYEIGQLSSNIPVNDQLIARWMINFVQNCQFKQQSLKGK